MQLAVISDRARSVLEVSGRRMRVTAVRDVHRHGTRGLERGGLDTYHVAGKLELPIAQCAQRKRDTFLRLADVDPAAIVARDVGLACLRLPRPVHPHRRGGVRHIREVDVAVAQVRPERRARDPGGLDGACARIGLGEHDVTDDPRITLADTAASAARHRVDGDDRSIRRDPLRHADAGVTRAHEVDDRIAGGCRDTVVPHVLQGATAASAAASAALRVEHQGPVVAGVGHQRPGGTVVVAYGNPQGAVHADHVTSGIALSVQPATPVLAQRRTLAAVRGSHDLGQDPLHRVDRALLSALTLLALLAPGASHGHQRPGVARPRLFIGIRPQEHPATALPHRRIARGVRHVLLPDGRAALIVLQEPHERRQLDAGADHIAPGQLHRDLDLTRDLGPLQGRRLHPAHHEQPVLAHTGFGLGVTHGLPDTAQVLHEGTLLVGRATLLPVLDAAVLAHHAPHQGLHLVLDRRLDLLGAQRRGAVLALQRLVLLTHQRQLLAQLLMPLVDDLAQLGVPQLGHPLIKLLDVLGQPLLQVADRGVDAVQVVLLLGESVLGLLVLCRGSLGKLRLPFHPHLGLDLHLLAEPVDAAPQSLLHLLDHRAREVAGLGQLAVDQPVDLLHGHGLQHQLADRVDLTAQVLQPLVQLVVDHHLGQRQLVALGDFFQPLLEVGQRFPGRRD